MTGLSPRASSLHGERFGLRDPRLGRLYPPPSGRVRPLLFPKRRRGFRELLPPSPPPSPSSSQGDTGRGRAKKGRSDPSSPKMFPWPWGARHTASAVPLSGRRPRRAPTEQQSPRAARERGQGSNSFPGDGMKGSPSWGVPPPTPAAPSCNSTAPVSEKTLIRRGGQQHFRGAGPRAGGGRRGARGRAGAGVPRAGPGPLGRPGSGERVPCRRSTRRVSPVSWPAERSAAAPSSRRSGPSRRLRVLRPCPPPPPPSPVRRRPSPQRRRRTGSPAAATAAARGAAGAAPRARPRPRPRLLPRLRRRPARPRQPRTCRPQHRRRCRVPGAAAAARVSLSGSGLKESETLPPRPPAPAPTPLPAPASPARRSPRSLRPRPALVAAAAAAAPPGGRGLAAPRPPPLHTPSPGSPPRGAALRPGCGHVPRGSGRGCVRARPTSRGCRGRQHPFGLFPAARGVCAHPPHPPHLYT